MRNRWLLWMSAVLLVSPVAAHAQSGAPAADNPIYVAFQQLEKAPAYHTRITLQSNDPRMAQMAATGMGFSPMEKTVKGGTTQVIMHLKMPAFDTQGAVDDWEIRAVAQRRQGGAHVFLACDTALEEDAGADVRHADGYDG